MRASILTAIVLSSLCNLALGQHVTVMVSERAAVPELTEDTAAESKGSPDDGSTAASPSAGPEIPGITPMRMRIPLYSSKAPLGSTQELTQVDLQDDLLGYEEAVRRIELSANAYDLELYENLFSLGQAYRRIGDYDNALAAYDRAFHINRINEGLFNTGQQTLIREISDTHFEKGDVSEAFEQQEYLYYLRRRIFRDDPEKTVEAQLAFADWSYGMAELSYHAGLVRSGEFLMMLTLSADSYYNSAMSLLATRDPRHPLLGFISMQRARSNYYTDRFLSLLTGAARPTAPPLATNGLSDSFLLSELYGELQKAGYASGRQALQDRVALLRPQAQESPQELLLALLDLADWNLLFMRRGAADDHYEEAIALVRESMADRLDLLDSSLFAPDLPIRMPAYVPEENSREAFGISPDTQLPRQAWADMEFTVNAFGRAGNVRVLGASPGLEEVITEQLRRQLDDSYFRPVINLESGKRETRTYQVRYYLSFLTAA